MCWPFKIVCKFIHGTNVTGKTRSYSDLCNILIQISVIFSQHRASEILHDEEKMEDLSKKILSGNLHGIFSVSIWFLVDLGYVHIYMEWLKNLLSYNKNYDFFLKENHLNSIRGPQRPESIYVHAQHRYHMDVTPGTLFYNIVCLNDESQ